MEDTPKLYDTLLAVLRHCRQWLDVRHMKTLAWMVTGLLLTEKISLSAWVPPVQSRAAYAQSTVRRFARWLDNARINVNELYGPLIQQALADWGDSRLRLALDTSMLWEKYCIVRISVVYRGRAVPLVWTVLEHASSSVAYEVYAYLLDEAAKLVPANCAVVFLADRGFADTDLMQHLTHLRWHWRIRIKGSFQVYYQGKFHKLQDVKVAQGQARFWHKVGITRQQCFGPVYLALARPNGLRECWYVVSDEPTDQDTFAEYRERFDIEENFLDDKSNGFQLEASLIRSAEALTRLCLVLAVATLYLVLQGTEVVAQGKRRCVDPHWFRGNSYLRIGWQWVKMALYRGWDLTTHLHLPGGPDPEPARSSNKQFHKRRQRQLQAISSNLCA